MHKQFDLWCISILTKNKTFSANNFLSGTVYTLSTILNWHVYTYTTHKMLEHCNLMSMYLYFKSKIYLSE